jgi:hypothetical protein
MRKPPRYRHSILHRHSFAGVAGHRSNHPAAAVADSTWAVDRTEVVGRMGLARRIAADRRIHDRRSARRCFEVAEGSPEGHRRGRSRVPYVNTIRFWKLFDACKACLFAAWVRSSDSRKT